MKEREKERRVFLSLQKTLGKYKKKKSMINKYICLHLLFAHLSASSHAFSLYLLTPKAFHSMLFYCCKSYLGLIIS
jgi:hypothetical protein